MKKILYLLLDKFGIIVMSKKDFIHLFNKEGDLSFKYCLSMAYILLESCILSNTGLSKEVRDKAMLILKEQLKDKYERKV